MLQAIELVPVTRAQEDLRPVLAQHDKVLDVVAHTVGLPMDWLDGEHHIGFKCGVGVGVQHGAFVQADAEAVAHVGMLKLRR